MVGASGYIIAEYSSWVMHVSMFIIFCSVGSKAQGCNLIGSMKFLNRNKLDVHDSPDPFSLSGWIGEAGPKITLA